MIPQGTIKRLLNYAYSHHKDEVISAMQTFFDRSDLGAGGMLEMVPYEEGMFNEFFVYEYKTEKGQTIVDEYCESNPDALATETLAYYHGLRETIFGIFEIVDVEKHKSLGLRHLASGLSYKVKENKGTVDAKKGQAIITRIALADRDFVLVGSDVPRVCEELDDQERARLKQLQSLTVKGAKDLLRFSFPYNNVPGEGVYRDEKHDVMDAYYDILENPHVNEDAYVDAMFDLINKDPNFFDPYVQLSEIGSSKTRARLVGKGFARAVDYINTQHGHPPARMPWSWIGNRHILRIFHTWACLNWEAGMSKEAVSIMHLLLRLNPGDDQGVRYDILALRLGLGIHWDERFVIHKGTPEERFDSEQVDAWFFANMDRFAEDFAEMVFERDDEIEE